MSTIVFPGQGAQHKGMGAELFEEFDELCAIASRVLAYSIRDLCTEDSENCLNLTQFTQPALYTVNALHYFHHLKKHQKPDMLAGHSLGEYNALLAAGVFDFETGLRLVQKRGQLMSQAKNGAMLAIIRSSQNQVNDILSKHQLSAIDVANYNSPSQLVLSGEASEMSKAKAIFDSEKILSIPLKVSGAFHSRQMNKAAQEYREFLHDFEFSAMEIPVIANVTGQPHQDDRVKDLLVKQLCESVQWTNSIQYLMTNGQTEFIEVGPGKVLTKLNDEIINNTDPQILIDVPKDGHKAESEFNQPVAGINLGSKVFLHHHQVNYPYVAGSMGYGISSEKLVIKMAQSGFLASLGSSGLSIHEVERQIKSCSATLSSGQSYAVNLDYDPDNLNFQKQLIELCINHQVPCLEVSGFDHISLEMVKYRVKGLSQSLGAVVIKNKILLKTSQPETAVLFMQSVPKHFLDKLLSEQSITEEQYKLAQGVPVADDICVEGDGGWKTAQASTLVRLPEIIRLKNQMTGSLNSTVRIGSSGGLGTPEAIAAVFMLGADFILTGSINQCTVEANTSDHVKQILSALTSEDTCCVPAGDLFESGARAQVVRKGLYFPARAQKLYDLYRIHDGVEDISPEEKRQIEAHFFHRSFESVFQEIIDTEDINDINKSNESRKVKMAKIFKWYFEYTKKLTIDGNEQHQSNYQIYCGPAMGAFNQWAKGGPLENWQNRHVDEIALNLLKAAVEFLKSEAEAA